MPNQFLECHKKHSFHLSYSKKGLTNGKNPPKRKSTKGERGLSRGMKINGSHYESVYGSHDELKTNYASTMTNG